MSGIFDIKKGAFDSTEASLLHQAYEIALQGLKATHKVDRALVDKLAGSIVRVARSEPDCLRDGSIDPVRLAQRAILRMLQTAAPSYDLPLNAAARKPGVRERVARREAALAGPEAPPPPPAPASPSKIMQRLFERTPFAKL